MGTRDTSKEAFEMIKGKLGEKQEKVLESIKQIETTEKEAPTNMEIATNLKWSINRVTPRVLELRKQGKIKQEGKRKCKITGRNAMTWTHRQK